MSNWLFHLKPITPLHIGSGDTLEPYEYAVLDGNLYCFDPYELLPQLGPELQNRFLDLVATSPGELQRLLHEHAALVKTSRLARFNIPLAAEAQQLYRQQLDNRRATLTIFPFIKTSGKPFIPGSSLKGAIRTALLYHRLKEHTPLTDAKKLEQHVFGYRSVTDDPFKTLKIGDSQPLANCTQVSAVRLFTKRGESWQEGVLMFRELILSEFSSSSPPTFVHSVELTEEVARQAASLRLTMPDIITSCRAFYGLHALKERTYLGKLPHCHRLYDRLNDLLSRLPDDSFPVRLGWGSGFDAVTVNYALRTPQAKRSRRLAEKGIPLGWATVEVKPC
ncbi:MAG: type III-A CRISPR-associated RAMP protein Csm5 [Dehalococcoidia bacterium]